MQETEAGQLISEANDCLLKAAQALLQSGTTMLMEARKKQKVK